MANKADSDSLPDYCYLLFIASPLSLFLDLLQSCFKPSPEVSVIFGWFGHLKMAECLDARLTAQEEQIRLLSQEIYNLRDGLSISVDIEGVSPLLDSLRSDNEKLRYRLVHLRRGLQAELRLQGRLGKTPQQVPKLKAPKTVASKSGKESDGGDNKVITKTL